MEGRKVFSAGELVTTEIQISYAFDESGLKKLDREVEPNESKKDQKRASKTDQVLIERDNADGRAKKFKTGFPQGLTGRLKPEEFHLLITRINQMFLKAEEGSWKNDIRGFLSSLPMIKMFIDSPAQKAEKRMKFYVMMLNVIFKTRGVYFHDPYMAVDHMEIDVRDDYDFIVELPL